MRVNVAKLVVIGALTAVALISSNLASITPAAAQEKADPKEKKRTKIDFEDELVEGELKKPELFYLLQKKQFNFKRLIKLRENFLPEMRRDADKVRSQRSK